MELSNYVFIAIGPNCYGRGKTQQEAIQHLKRANGRYNKLSQYAVYLAHPDSTVSEIDGAISYPKGFPPVTILRHGFKD